MVADRITGNWRVGFEAGVAVVSTMPDLTNGDIFMFTLKEAAAAMNVGLSKLKELVDSGEIKTVPWGNERRIPAWHIREWQSKKLNFNENKVRELLES